MHDPHEIALRPLARSDFPLLRAWLEVPHVKRWWDHDTSPDAVEADFGPCIDGDDPAELFVASWRGRPVGFIQRYLYGDNPGYLEEVSRWVQTPPAALSIDYFIGEPELLRQGIGAAMIRTCTESTWHDHADAPCIIVPVHATNTASWKVLERAGYRFVAEADLEPDNPVDSREHRIYRIDRPMEPGIKAANAASDGSRHPRVRCS